MNLQEYLQREGLVILTTDRIYEHLNFDRRTNFTKRNNQLELDFNGNPPDHEPIRHSSTTSLADFRTLASTINSMEKILKSLTRGVTFNFPDVHCELMINDETKCIKENYLHLIACNQNGTPLDESAASAIHEYLQTVLDEITLLIKMINDTITIIDINSIKLVSQKSDQSDHIQYSDPYAGEFTHALFNSDLKKLKLATNININNTPISLTDPILQDQKVFLDIPHIIVGTLEIESRTSRKIHARGHYLDNGIVTNKSFSEMIFCKGTGDQKEAYESLFHQIDTEFLGKELKYTAKTLQPYVCMEGIDSKTKFLVSIDEIAQ